MSRELQHDGYLVSDDPARLDADAVHAYLSKSYWAENIPREIVARSLQNSLCAGIYSATGAQVGLVRVISDYATFAWICDVYVLESHRGRGLSKAALRMVLSHPKLQNLRRIALATRDAHSLYGQLGFKSLAKPENFMEIHPSDIYRRPPA